MTKQLVAIGEMLGGFSHGNGLKFFVKYGGEEIELDPAVYNVWLAIKMTLSSREDIVSLMQQSSKLTDSNSAINELINKKLVIEWKEQYEDSIFEQYSLVPKGKVLRIKEADYYLLAFSEAEPVNLSMMAYFLWRNAHPFLSCNSTLISIQHTIGVDLHNIKNDFIRWIPILVMYDLLAFVPISGFA